MIININNNKFIREHDVLNKTDALKIKKDCDKQLNNLKKELKISNNKFKYHNHTTDLTCVYILKNKYPEYGTRLDNDIIIEAKENSLLIFNGEVIHSITNMPKILGNKNPRYSIVMDFNYE